MLTPDDIRNQTVRISASSSSRPLDRFVLLQNANGSWDLTAQFAEEIEIPVEELLSALLAVEGLSEIHSVLFTTAVAIIHLETEFRELKDEWELIAQKAMKWIKKTATEMNVDAKVIQEAAKKLIDLHK